MIKNTTKLPQISIITPSFNQAKFIEETLLSVLDQNYPNLEYIVIDGGSTDGTLNILEKYKDRLVWISEPDLGQANAINKGLKQAGGDVVAFLNSDDLYLPGTLDAVGQYFSTNPHASWLTGFCRNTDENGREIRKFIRLYKNLWLNFGNNYQSLLVLNFISQPSTFWRHAVMRDVGYLNEELHYTLDYEYWLRIGKKHKLHILHQNLSSFRIHSHSKSGTTTHLQFDEELDVARKYTNNLSIWLHKLHCIATMAVYKQIMKVQS